MIDRGRFFAELRPLAGRLRQDQVEAAETLLGFIESDPPPLMTQAAYYLATAWHETAATLRPVRERGTVTYLEQRYDPLKGSTPNRRARALAMGNVQPGDGVRYCGRGYVQLTWANNYRLFSDRLEVDLLTDPDLALRPDLAYRILHLGLQQGLFTGAALGTYLRATATDYIGARRCVNGLDRAMQIARYAQTFARALGAHGSP